MANITTCTGCRHHGLPSDSEPCWDCYGEHSMARKNYEPEERVLAEFPRCKHCNVLLPRVCASVICPSCRELERLIRVNPTAARKILREVWREEMGL